MTDGPVLPACRERLAVWPIAGGGMRIEGGFWGAVQARNREVTIPHGMRMLEESGSTANLRLAAPLAGRAEGGGRSRERSAGEYAMPLFRDSDVYKVLEAIAWERRRGRDAAQEAFFAEMTRLAAAAQRPDGYLNSYVEVVEGGRRFANPAMGHELYCAGHLFQAAVADLRTGGDPDGLAAVAGRYADLLVKEADGELAEFVPGHPEVETALVELGRAAQRDELVQLAGTLIARRGSSRLRWRSLGPDYYSDDVPFAAADRVRGHAVRALYLLSGAADVYTEAGGTDLLRAALAQWTDMTAGKTYLTGGVGSRHEDEAFGEPFELPPDQAYCETCAAVASVMWNWRLLLITGQARFADLLERTLYNGLLAGLGLDGRSFFYVNPLASRGPGARRPWYECACCPPNIMRLLASLDCYLATSTADGVQVHQFASGGLRAELPAAGTLALRIATDYPAEGAVRLQVTEAPAGQADVAIRVPSWAAKAQVELNGQPLPAKPGSDGYLHLRRAWSAGDQLSVEFGLALRVVRPDPRIDAVRGCVAYERGPLVYCVESADLPTGLSLDDVTVAPGARPRTGGVTEVAGHSVTALTLPGLARDHPAEPSWPYLADPPDQGAPAPGPARRTEFDLRAVPYYAWANRGPARMRVWLPTWQPG